jgi:hydrogenase/urease accessory protein HupE
MNLAKRFNHLSALTLFSALTSPAVYAHPGHETGAMLHGILHTEHLLILLAIGVAIAIGVVIKD